MSSAPSSLDVFRAVADPTRRALLDCLRQAEHSVNDLARPFRMTQPAVSQHLRILRQAGLVRGRKCGRERMYRLNPEPLREVYEWAARHKPFVDPFGHAWSVRKAH
jgi:DNA-binding transcriptional ArsR family regulator